MQNRRADRNNHTPLGRLASIAGHPAAPVILTAAIGALDWIAGPHISLGLLYLLPLTIATWYGRTGIALAIALALPVLRLSYFVFDVWEPPGTFAHVALNATVRAGVLVAALLLVRHARRSRELERELAALRGMLPICMYCKRIQTTEGTWQPVEQYVAERTEADFTHRVCPYCTETHGAVFLGSR